MYNLILVSGTNQVFCPFLSSWMAPALNKLHRSGWIFSREVVSTGMVYSYQGIRVTTWSATLHNVCYVPIDSNEKPNCSLKCVLAHPFSVLHLLCHLTGSGVGTGLDSGQWKSVLKLTLRMWGTSRTAPIAHSMLRMPPRAAGSQHGKSWLQFWVRDTKLWYGLGTWIQLWLKCFNFPVVCIKHTLFCLSRWVFCLFQSKTLTNT